jgi:hypothetical protein
MDSATSRRGRALKIVMRIRPWVDDEMRRAR